MTHLAFNAPTAVPFQFWIQSWCYKQDVCFSDGAMLLEVLHAQTGSQGSKASPATWQITFSRTR